MGMYTELVLKCGITKEIDDEAHNVLMHIFGEGEKPNKLPSHKFFDTTRWSFIAKTSSFYHIPFPLSNYCNVLDSDKKGGHIFSRSDFKNYESELNLFIDWIMPYIDEYPGRCIGWSWYEEDDSPTLIYKK